MWTEQHRFIIFPLSGGGGNAGPQWALESVPGVTGGGQNGEATGGRERASSYLDVRAAGSAVGGASARYW